MTLWLIAGTGVLSFLIHLSTNGGMLIPFAIMFVIIMLIKGIIELIKALRGKGSSAKPNS